MQPCLQFRALLLLGRKVSHDRGFVYVDFIGARGRCGPYTSSTAFTDSTASAGAAGASFAGHHWLGRADVKATLRSAKSYLRFLVSIGCAAIDALGNFDRHVNTTWLAAIGDDHLFNRNERGELRHQTVIQTQFDDALFHLRLHGPTLGSVE